MISSSTFTNQYGYDRCHFLFSYIRYRINSVSIFPILVVSIVLQSLVSPTTNEWLCVCPCTVIHIQRGQMPSPPKTLTTTPTHHYQCRYAETHLPKISKSCSWLCTNINWDTQVQFYRLLYSRVIVVTPVIIFIAQSSTPVLLPSSATKLCTDSLMCCKSLLPPPSSLLPNTLQQVCLEKHAFQKFYVGQQYLA